MRQLELSEVKKLAGKIKINKSSCLEHVRAQVIKDVLLEKPELLGWIINSSLMNGIFPRYIIMTAAEYYLILA